MCPTDESDTIISALLGFQFVALLGLGQTLLSTKDGHGFKMLLTLKFKGDAYRRHVTIQVLWPQPIKLSVQLGIGKPLLNQPEHQHFRNPSLANAGQSVPFTKKVFRFPQHFFDQFYKRILDLGTQDGLSSNQIDFIKGIVLDNVRPPGEEDTSSSVTRFLKFR